MKKILLFIVLFIASAAAFAQAPDYSRKFGKVTDYELGMTSYARDTSAVAVYLYEDTQVFYTIATSGNSNPFSQTRNYYVKIKVLKPEGVSLADVAIPFHSGATAKESVSGISAVSYNKVDGKTVKMEVKSKDVFTEQVSENTQLRKFSIPEVRVGTVIEYKYVITSDFFWMVDPVRIQHEYPVVYSFSEVATPQYFRFNINTQGYHSVIVKQSRRNNADYYDDVRTCVALDVPALKSESHVWNIDDFRTKISFELQAVDIPGYYYQSYASTWESINENLEKSDFNLNLKMNNPLKDEVAAIKAEGGEEAMQVRKILKLVTGRMNWDGKYTIWGKTVRQKLRDGAGSSADINFVLNSALRDAGFNTTPVLLSPRNYGRLPYGHPSIDNIRAFVLRVDLSDGSSLFVDGTSGDNDLNLIPTQFMVDRARVYGMNGADGWVDLTSLSDNRQQISVRCEMDADGRITGVMENGLSNASGFALKSRYRDAGSEDEYVDKLEVENDMEISSYEISGLDEATVTETLDFSMKSEKSGLYIYLRSTIVPFITKSTLSQQERILPVEFTCPGKYDLVAFVLIPDEYEIEEVPKPIKMNACENGVSYIYTVHVNGNTLVIQMRYTLDRIVFAPKEYPDLHTFMGMMIEKNNARIILKKKI